MDKLVLTKELREGTKILRFEDYVKLSQSDETSQQTPDAPEEIMDSYHSIKSGSRGLKLSTSVHTRASWETAHDFGRHNPVFVRDGSRRKQNRSVVAEDHHNDPDQSPYCVNPLETESSQLLPLAARDGMGKHRRQSSVQMRPRLGKSRSEAVLEGAKKRELIGNAKGKGTRLPAVRRVSVAEVQARNKKAQGRRIKGEIASPYI